MKQVIIIGTGGHAKVIADIVLLNNDQIIGFLDDNYQLSEFIGFPVLGKVECFKNYRDAHFIIAIGSNKVRQLIANKLSGVKWYTAIHPTAIISKLQTTIGEGSMIIAGAIINPNSQIGKHCIINSGSIVDHDNIIEDFVHLSSGAMLAGTVHIKSGTWIGIGATIKNNVSITSDCIIGAGTLVINNIEEAGTYVGVPSRKL